MQFSRKWAMPNKDTFSIKSIGEFVARYLIKSQRSIDPFARNFQGATITNDLDPDTVAQFHLEAVDFLCQHKDESGVDLAIFDPPYSPRQISECYKGVGKAVGTKETQNAALYKACRDAIDVFMVDGGIVLSFGWNSNGMGKGRRYDILEIMLVAHGGGHNDTICIAERKQATLFGE